MNTSLKKEMNTSLKKDSTTVMHVGFVVDDGYVKYMAVTIASILKNSKENEAFCFHVINDGSISDKSKQNIDELLKIKTFTITWHCMNKKIHHEQRDDTRQDIPMVTNYRLLLSSTLIDVDKIIFLDADLIILDSLKELWETNVSDYYIATTPSPYDSLKEYKMELGISNDYMYCNTGVMLVNLQKWRLENIESKLMETERKYRGVYKFYDQCVLNAALFDKIFYISQKWNFRPGIWNNKKKYCSDSFKTPKIVHWASPVKPWKDNTVRYAKEYFFYAKLTPYYKIIKSQLLPLWKIVAKKIASFIRKACKKTVKIILGIKK